MLLTKTILAWFTREVNKESYLHYLRHSMIDLENIQPPPSASTLPPLWSHQEEALRRAGNKFALFFDPGTGKTRTAIELWKRSVMPSKTIIFAPLNVVRNWENELKLYLQGNFTVHIVSGQSKAKKLQILENFVKANEECESPVVHGKFPVPQFLICNIETLRSREYQSLLSKSSAKFIIIDESHNFKSPSSEQTKGLLGVVSKLKPKHLYLLTGTPCPQGEIDLYTTFLLLEKTNENFFVWRKRHFDDKNERRRGMNNYWPEYVIRPVAKQYFQELLQECSLSAKKDKVLDLPELIRTNLYSEMSPEQRKCYESMTEYLFAIDKDGNELNAANMLTRTLRLQQILAGFLGDVPIKGNARLEALGDAIDLARDEQFIIWTIFKATYGQIGKYLSDRNISFAMLTGEQDAQERYYNMEDFQKGNIRALIAHPKAGGIGVNLTAASVSVHYTRSFSLTDDLQCEARNYRGGSERHARITRIDIITPHTIDEDIAAALKSKKSVQDFILGLKEKHNGRK